MDFHVRLHGHRDLARQVHRQVREAILVGRLRRGDRLPATRVLAQRLGVSRNTVCLAYEWLVAEGLVSGLRGGGTLVEALPVAPSPRRPAAVLSARPVWNAIEPPSLPSARPPYDLGVGSPDATLFPFDVWRRRLARQVRVSALRGEYGDPAGHPRLRAAIARYVGVSRGVNAGAEEVVVTSGAQGAFDLVARVLLEPGAQVVVEEPGYPPARLLFQSYGARVRPVRVDSAGLDVEALPQEARLVYVTPSHQFPLGMPMSHARRVALLEWAERCGAVIIEDDYDSEFRFGGRPLDTLQALDRGGRVVYVGSFSKSLLPALRLGFLVAPSSLAPALRVASYVATWHAQWPAQACLASLIEEGLLARHVGRMRRAYAERHELVLAALERDFSGWLAPVPAVTGMHVAATLLRGGTRLEDALARQALRRGVAFDRLSRYCAERPVRAGVVLGYGAIPRDRLAAALQRLRAGLLAASRDIRLAGARLSAGEGR